MNEQGIQGLVKAIAGTLNAATGLTPDVSTIVLPVSEIRILQETNTFLLVHFQAYAYAQIPIRGIAIVGMGISIFLDDQTKNMLKREQQQ